MLLAWPMISTRELAVAVIICATRPQASGFRNSPLGKGGGEQADIYTIARCRAYVGSKGPTVLRTRGLWPWPHFCVELLFRLDACFTAPPLTSGPFPIWGSSLLLAFLDFSHSSSSPTTPPWDHLPFFCSGLWSHWEVFP